jgi:ubiquinone/menaquinone biosynthesis C-methylase UbiE
VFSDPKKNLEQFDLAPSMKVADFGSGAGYYTFFAARTVGESGRVYALDINKDLLVTTKREAEKGHLFNVETIWVDMEKPLGSKLKTGSIERGIVANVMFQVKDRPVFVGEVGRVLRAGGKVLVVDWTDSFGGIGPASTDILPEEACKELFLQNGFELEKKISAGAHHYGFIFKKR